MFGFNNMAKTLKTLNDKEIAIIKNWQSKGNPAKKLWEL